MRGPLGPRTSQLYQLEGNAPRSGMPACPSGSSGSICQAITHAQRFRLPALIKCLRATRRRTRFRRQSYVPPPDSANVTSDSASNDLRPHARISSMGPALSDRRRT
jgi:hypothetical protein